MKKKECSFNIVLLAAGLGGVFAESDLKNSGRRIKNYRRKQFRLIYHSQYQAHPRAFTRLFSRV